MTNHSLVGAVIAGLLAGEVRAEMARQKRTAGEMAGALGITPHTAGRRLNGATPFNVVELGNVAHWLGMTPDVLVQRAEERFVRADRPAAS
ncbi:BetR domain-containing protein [Microbacterium sp. AG238]|nr:BetR domain-containing protein [Microbacterium sp. AG238]